MSSIIHIITELLFPISGHLLITKKYYIMKKKILCALAISFMSYGMINAQKVICHMGNSPNNLGRGPSIMLTVVKQVQQTTGMPRTSMKNLGELLWDQFAALRLQFLTSTPFGKQNMGPIGYDDTFPSTIQIR